jgi:type 1 glutamine amidotransferase
MRDRQGCPDAARRVAEMAPYMNTSVSVARDAGVLIIHAPVGAADFYAGTPEREKAVAAPYAKMPTSLSIAAPPIPIDDTDGGCSGENTAVQSRQAKTLTIRPGDLIVNDTQELFNVLEAYHRDNLIVMGNPLAVCGPVGFGRNVVLMRDLSDATYNPERAPYVSHYRGTELVAAYIETYWCPTTTSTYLTGQAPFRFADDDRVHAVFLLHEPEYNTKTTASRFAEKELAEAFGWNCTYLWGDGQDSIPGLAVLDDADMLFVSVRRQALPKADLARIQSYCASGRPVVGIRTASHAFALRGDNQPPEGHATWPEFDADILGGHYTGHTDNKDPAKPRTYVWALDSAKGNPLLQGVRPDRFETTSWLYKTSPLAATATPLMMGQVQGEGGPEPVAWTNRTADGSRVFYTSLGHPDDFRNLNFRRLLLNGILWATGPVSR